MEQRLLGQRSVVSHGYLLARWQEKTQHDYARRQEEAGLKRLAPEQEELRSPVPLTAGWKEEGVEDAARRSGRPAREVV
jgi:hypothetical protein